MMRAGFILLCMLMVHHVQGQGYLKVIGDDGRDERGFVAYTAPTGEILLAGSVADSALVMRIDVDGGVLWSRTFKPQGQLPKNVFHLSSAPDGTLIGCGNGYNGSNEPREGFHFRMDMSGNMIWVRNWTDPLVYNRRLIALNAAEYILFSGRYDMSAPTYADVLTARIDAASGNVISTSGTLDLNSAVPYVDEVIGVATLGQAHYATSAFYANGAPVSTRRVALSKFDYFGGHLWTNYLLFPNNVDRRVYPSDIIAHDDSLTIAYFGDINGSSGNFTQGLIRLDTLGNVAWARDFNVAGSGQEHGTKVIATTFGYLVAGRTSLSNPNRLFLQAISPSGVLLWTKSYGDLAQEQTLVDFYASNLCALSDGFMMTGMVEQGGGDTDILLVRTDPNGDIVCAQVNTVGAITTILPEDTYTTPVQESAFAGALTFVATVVNDGLINDLCLLEVDLGNDTTLCGSLILDAGVPNAIYEWQDGSTGQTLEVPESGEYWVRVTVDCCVASDTIVVDLGALAGVDLGADTVLCVGQELVIQLPTGTWSYEWQDGTTNSEYVVYDSGTYWVTAVDGPCVASDTIDVAVLDVPSVELGDDIVSCDGNGALLSPEVTDVTDLLWLDGSTGGTLQVDTTGFYTVEVSNLCGTSSDGVNVTVLEAVLLDLGPDTTLCAGTTYTLTVDLPGWDLAWSDGSAGTSFTISEEGIYWLDIGQAGCFLSDTVVITGVDVPSLTLGADTTVCNGDSLLLAPALVDVDQVFWSDGSSENELMVTATGTYTLEASNGCGTTIATIDVVIVPPLAIDLGADTVLCGMDTLFLDLSASGTTLTWQDGSTLSAFLIGTAGTYWVDAELDGCVASDTLVVQYDSLPELDLGADTVLCTVPFFTLDALDEDAVWQDGSTGATYTAMRTGLYVATITNYCGSVADTVRVSFAVPTVPIADVDLCPGERVELDPQGELLQTVWTTGDTARTIQVGEGTYGYLAVDIHGCEHTDIVEVRITSPRDGTVYIPNSFSPNGDGLNDAFIVAGPEASDFELAVFDRWGVESYRTLDPFKGWDGNVGGAEAPQDVYVYVVTYQDRCNANNTAVTQRGHVTLIR